MSDLTCCKCGEEMSPIMFKDEEYRVEHGTTYKTGRYRAVCSHLQCEYCGHTECVDGDFMAGPWIQDRK